MTRAGGSGLGVRCVRLGHTYRIDGADVPALSEVDLTVEPGQSVAILGPSGSGKSTLLALLAGLRRPTTGQLFIGADEITSMNERELLDLRGRCIGVVVQNPARNVLPYGSAQDNIRFARRSVPRYRRHALPEPIDLLTRLGLAELAGQPVGRMSGGEQQRVSVALGMAAAPGLLLADEPTSQLDTANRDRVVTLLQRVGAEFGATVIVVTHDPEVAASLDRAVTILDGRLHIERPTHHPGEAR